MVKSLNDTTRRTFLKRAGAGSVAVGATLAGCIGGGGDGSGDGGGGDGSSDGGGGDGASTSDGKLTPITMGYPPWANYLILKHLQNTGVLPERLAEAGYVIDKTIVSWDDITLFAAGQSDFSPTLGDIEGAVLASQRGLKLTFHGMQSPNYEGWYVREGSDVDPANTGSVEATVQKLLDEQRPVGFAGWNQGAVWPCALVFSGKFGVDYGTPEATPLNMRQADFFACPQLLADGEVDILVDNAPILGTDEYVAMDDNPLKEILWYQPIMEELGVSPKNLNLGMYVTTQQFSDEHIEFVRAFMDAWTEGVEWVYNTDNWSDVLADEDNWNYLTANTKEEARINLEFSYQNKYSDNLVPLAFEDIELTDSRIKGTKDAIDKMVELGMPVNENWKENIEFKNVSLDST